MMQVPYHDRQSRPSHHCVEDLRLNMMPSENNKSTLLLLKINFLIKYHQIKVYILVNVYHHIKSSNTSTTRKLCFMGSAALPGRLAITAFMPASCAAIACDCPKQQKERNKRGLGSVG